jgi:hypothetical protein
MLNIPMRKKFQVHLIAALAAVCVLHGCGPASHSDAELTNATGDDLTDMQSAYAEKVQDIFRAVPSPMEMASMLKKMGSTYDHTILNDVKNANSYTSSRSQALNLGIYGANLSYASVFNQNQEAIIYLSCVKKLADNLGVTSAFGDATIERMEANVDNRDSLLTIVSETYYELDAYLKENGREYISAMVIAAGWVEGLHISTAIAAKDATPGQEILTRIGEQKLSLMNLIELVNAYNRDGQVDEIAADLAALELAFRDVQISGGGGGTATESDGTTVIGSPTQVSISPETLRHIRTTVAEIRTRYIS